MGSNICCAECSYWDMNYIQQLNWAEKIIKGECMNCDKCGQKSVGLYGIPIGRFAHMPDPMVPKWCYECYVEYYGTDEEREVLEAEKAVDQSIDNDIEFSRHGL